MSERLHIVTDVILVPGLGDQTDEVQKTTSEAADQLAAQRYTAHPFSSNWDNPHESLSGKRTRLGAKIQEVADSSEGMVGLLGYSHGGNLALLAGKEKHEVVGAVVAVHTRTHFLNPEEGVEALLANPAGADSVDLVHRNWPSIAAVLGGRVATVRIPGADDRVPEAAMQLPVPDANNQEVILLGKRDRPIRGHGPAIHTLLTSDGGASAIGTLISNPKATIKVRR